MLHFDSDSAAPKCKLQCKPAALTLQTWHSRGLGMVRNNSLLAEQTQWCFDKTKTQPTRLSLFTGGTQPGEGAGDGVLLGNGMKASACMIF